MPRPSAEARAMEFYNSDGKYPDPPHYLQDQVKEIWNRIVVSKPIDWWEPGNLPLLEAYCNAVYQSNLIQIELGIAGYTQDGLHTKQMSAEFQVYIALTKMMSMLADKLRLTVQASVDGRSGKIDEKGLAGDEKPFGLFAKRSDIVN